MAKATLQFEDGTTATLEGTPEEVAKLLDLLRRNLPSVRAEATPKHTQTKSKSTSKRAKSAVEREEVSLVDIINAAKDSDDSDAIEKEILDRTSQVDRVLLPLYLVYENFQEHLGLTSGEISKITRELGIPIHTSNVANTLAGPASKYVIGDGVRKKGQAVRYRMSRKGHQYLQSVLAESSK